MRIVCGVEITATGSTGHTPQPNPTPADEWLTISEAADLLGVSVASLRRWDESGQLPAGRTPGGQRRYRRSTLNAAFGGAA